MKLLIFTGSPNCDRGSFKDRIGSYFGIFKSEGIEPTVSVLDKSFLKRIKQYRQADNFDVVLIHKKCLNFLDSCFFKPQKAQVIFNYDDAIMFNDKGRITRTHIARFKRSVQKANKILVGSSYLAQQAAAYHDDIVILPLGLKTDGYRSEMTKKEDGKIRLVWVGRPVTLDYIKELKDVIQRLAKKYPNLILRIICEEFIDIEGVTIEKMLWTPQIRYSGLSEADIGLAPLPDNPFTRGKCSFKVLEYSASGLPVVASPVGTNSDHVKDGQTGYLAHTNEQWFEKLSELIENKALRSEMGLKGLRLAAEHDTLIIGKKFVQILKSTSHS